MWDFPQCANPRGLISDKIELLLMSTVQVATSGRLQNNVGLKCSGFSVAFSM